jgi:hypothetical protein
LKTVKDLEDRQNRHSSTDANITLVYVGLGDRDQAMMWLDKAYQARFNPSILLRPAFDLLRSDSRFQDLLRRIGLPRVRGPTCSADGLPLPAHPLVTCRLGKRDL